MKIKRVSCFLLALIIIGAILGFSASAPEVSGSGEAYTIDEPYEYPLTPGADEWFAIEDHATKVQMLQIPEDILVNLTTEALVESVVNYPYLLDMDAFSTQDLGYQAVRDSFNGLQELESRPDGMSCLREYYETHSPNMSYEISRPIEIILAANSAAADIL